MIGKRIAVLAIISPLIFSASSLYLFSEPNNQFLESITPLLTSTPKLEEIPESPPVVAKEAKPSTTPVSEPVNSKIIQKSDTDKPKSLVNLPKNNTQRTVIYRTESRPIPAKTIPNYKFASQFMNTRSKKRFSGITNKKITRFR